MDVSRDIPDEEIWEMIDEAIAMPGQGRPSLRTREAAREQVFHALRGLDVLQELVEDPQITEIMVNGHENIFYERKDICDDCYANDCFWFRTFYRIQSSGQR